MSELPAPTDQLAPPWWWDNRLWKLNLVLLGIITVQITAGYDQVVVGSFQSIPAWIDTMGHPSPSRIGLVTTATFIGSFVGCIPASICADRFGRRSGLRVGALAAIAGSVLQASSFSYIQFVFGRTLVGFGVAFNVVAGPSLLAELAHPRQRGSVLGFFNNLWYVGSLVAAWTAFGTGHLSTSWSWRIPSILQLLPSALLIVILPLIPESPRYLYAKGRHDDAAAVLAKYHADGDANDILVYGQLEDIRSVIENEAVRAKMSWSILWKTKANLKATSCAVSVGFLTLWTGQSCISYYFSPILAQLGIMTTSEQTGINAGMQVWNLGISIAGSFLSDKIGRRPLWMISFVAMIAANIGTTISYSIASARPGNHSASYLVIVFFFLYNAGFNIGCNPLTFAYPAEVLPYRIRTKGLAVYVLGAYAMATLNIYINPIAIASIGWRFWLFYLGMLLLGLALIFFSYPETKGVSIDLVGQLFDKPARSPSIRLSSDLPFNHRSTEEIESR